MPLNLEIERAARHPALPLPLILWSPERIHDLQEVAVEKAHDYYLAEPWLC